MHLWYKSRSSWPDCMVSTRRGGPSSEIVLVVDGADLTYPPQRYIQGGGLMYILHESGMYISSVYPTTNELWHKKQDKRYTGSEITVDRGVTQDRAKCKSVIKWTVQPTPAKKSNNKMNMLMMVMINIVHRMPIFDLAGLCTYYAGILLTLNIFKLI